MSFCFSQRKRDLFHALVDELLASDEVQKLKTIRHHGMSCYDHSLFVAYLSFLWARRKKLDFRACARAGLLHDLYLYDSRDRAAHPGLQCFDHPVAAWRNAKKLTALSAKEENIILSHMWPVGKFRPKSREALLVNAVDTFCAAVELSRLYRLLGLEKRLPSSAVL